MNKWKGFRECMWGAGIALALAALLMFCFKIACPQSTVLEGDMRSLGTRPHVPYETHYQVEATADHWAVLVDLSDNPGYPHANTNSIILKSLLYAGDLQTVTHWHFNVGVVVGAPTVTDTDIIWITEGAVLKASRVDERWQMPEHGLNLLVDSDETLMFVLSNQLTTTLAITSTQLLPSPHSSLSGTVGVGDLVLFIDEQSDGGIFHFSIDTAYDTE